MIVEHKCKDCVFSIKENNVQTECKLGRAEKLGSTLDENGDFVLERFCNASRPEQWFERLNLKESLDLEAAVMNEVRPRVGFVVIFDGDMDDLKSTISDIKSQTFTARYVIVITSKVEFNEEIHELLRKTFDFDITNFHIVQIVSELKYAEFFMDEAFRHAKNGWMYVCHSSEKIRKDLIESMHKRVNVDMKRLVVVEPYDDNWNGLLFHTALFKFLNGNKTKIFQDEQMDSRLFLEKVKDVATKSHPETYITWREFNEQS